MPWYYIALLVLGYLIIGAVAAKLEKEFGSNDEDFQLGLYLLWPLFLAALIVIGIFYGVYYCVNCVIDLIIDGVKNAKERREYGQKRNILLQRKGMQNSSYLPEVPQLDGGKR